MNEQNMSGKCEKCDNKCGCGHHKVKPLAVILVGVTFLLGAFDVISATTVAITWPILVIIIGVMMMSGACKCCSK